MSGIYDKILAKYQIPRKQLPFILENPMEAYRKIHRNKQGIVEIIRIYDKLVRSMGTEKAKRRTSEFLELRDKNHKTRKNNR